MRGRRIWLGLVLSYVLGLVLIGWYFRNALNTDAVAYLRIATYYATGKLSLAISGYWGPLISWLMVLPLKLGVPALVVARGAMVFSALVFLGGSFAVYKTFGLPEKWLVTGGLLSAACGVYWSVRFITPDLLLSGLVGLAVSATIKRGNAKDDRNAILAGGLWGLAYLAKAVAFPLAILTTLSLAVAPVLRQKPERLVWVRKTALLLMAFLLIAGPWVAIISFRYQRLTFSTSARISHALTGPADVERYHPFALRFHRPDPGRVTTWEEPSTMDYRYWSPLASPAYALHQLYTLARNLPICLLLLTALEVAWLMPLFDMLLGSARRTASDVLYLKYLQSLIVPMSLLVLYLPASVNLAEQRFFYPAFPFLLAAVGLWANEKGQTIAGRSNAHDPIRIWWLAVLGVLAPLIGTAALLGNSPKFAGDCAVNLARRIERANIPGPIAGSGMLPGGRTGLYVAFLLNQPWYGDEVHPSPQGLQTSGARLAVVVRRSALAQELGQDLDFVNCDTLLFEEPQESAQFPLQVYEVKGWRTGRGP